MRAPRLSVLTRKYTVPSGTPFSVGTGRAHRPHPYRRSGRPAEAADRLAAARALAQEISVAEALTLVFMEEAEQHLDAGRAGEATTAVANAERLAVTLGPIELPAVRLLQARSFAATGDSEQARAAAWQAHRLANESGQRLIELRALEILAGLADPASAPSVSELATALRRDIG